MIGYVDTYPSSSGPPPAPGSYTFTGFGDAALLDGRYGLGFASGAAMAAGATNPIGLALMGGFMAVQLFLGRKGPDQKRSTSMVADEAERLMVENMAMFDRGEISRETALGNFDAAWGWLFQNCSAPSMGEPGQRCVNERKPGGQWDYFARYRQPIADAAAAPAGVPLPPDNGGGSWLPSPADVFSGQAGIAPEIGWAMIAGLLVLGATL